MQGASLARRIEHFLEGIPRAREEEAAVLVLLLAPPRLPVSGDRQLVRLSARPHDHQGGLFLINLNFIGRGQNFYDLIAVSERCGKIFLQMLAEHAIHRFRV